MLIPSTRIALLAASLLACGDGTPSPDAGIDAPFTAEAYEGLWLMTSLTITRDGAPVTLRRDGTSQSLRADVVLAAADAANATLSVRQAPLQGGLLASDVSHLVALAALEPTRWRITEPGGKVAVFTATGNADHLQLDRAAADPQHTSPDAPLQIVLDRAPPWGTTAVGDWDLVTMQLPDRLITAGACTELEAGQRWAKVTMVIRFSDRLLFVREMTTTQYSDAQCETLVGTSTSNQVGMTEHEGTTLRMWGLENGRAEFQAFTTTFTDDRAALTRTSCLPMPACNDTAPLEVAVRRR